MKSNFQLLNEGFSRMLKEAEEEYNASAEQSGETEEDFIDVGDLFTNGDETFKLLDVQVDEDGEVVVSAENNSTGESEEIEYVPKEETEDDVIISDDDTEELIDEIEECLHRMNEAQMSPEDAKDSEVLRNIYNKLQRRKNAKLTNDEHAVLKKYGLNASDGDVYKSYGNGRSFANLVNSSIPTNREYTSTSYRDIVNSDKINLADRARKISTRGSGYGPAKAARNGWYKNTLEAERASLNSDMQEPVDDMKRALSRRNEYRDGLNSVDAKYDAEIANLNKRREQDKAYYQQNLDKRQGDVDYMLKIARQQSNDKRKQRANKVESLRNRRLKESTNGIKKVVTKFDEFGDGKSKACIIQADNGKFFIYYGLKGFDADSLRKAGGSVLVPFDSPKEAQARLFKLRPSAKKINESKMQESDSSKKNWYGIPGIEFIWRGTQSDPLIKYNGQTINSSIVENTMWDRFNEEHPEICEKPVEIEWGTADYREWEDAMYDGFAEYMKQHAEDVKELFDMAADSDYYAECVRRNSKKRRGLKEARKSPRKKVTQKYLKDLIKSGKAENLNTWTDEQLNELQKKHYETIAVSFGINGMNGILLQDDDGKLYAVPSRSTTMFQMHKL